jgi:hypothetical protein
MQYAKAVEAERAGETGSAALVRAVALHIAPGGAVKLATGFLALIA